ncbi:MAG: Rrf2 family transcriptional regulator [Bacteroidales bacterium]|jgi:Rrf2 family iron-sulfur cluster assembly transcriptional regulator|nr:Rrf2 family transcriptional regulator [Bacteroidales bacterium]
MLSNTCKYAIRAVIYLALNGEGEKKIGIREISNKLKFPSPFLGKILQMLAKNKLLISTKGPNGGFCLARPANEITLLNIIEIIDGLSLFEDCLIGLSTCSSSAHSGVQCATHRSYLPISKQLYDLFNTQTIEMLANEIAASDGKIGL